MSIICSICGKKQSGLIQECYLSTDLAEYEICVKCFNNKEELLKHSMTNPKLYIEARTYFQSFLDHNKLQNEVNNYITLLLKTCDNNYNNFIKKQAEELEETEKREKKEKLFLERANLFPQTTSYNFEGYNIKKYIKVICSETILGTGFLSELSASFADFFGVECRKFSDKLQSARFSAKTKLIDIAIENGANAIIGIDYDYVKFNNNIIGVIVNGTAVIIEPIS